MTKKMKNKFEFIEVENMKRKRILIILGIICLIGSFIWMLISQASTGPFLFLAGAGGALLADGISTKEK